VPPVPLVAASSPSCDLSCHSGPSLTPDLRPRTSDLGLQTSVFRPRTWNLSPLPSLPPRCILSLHAFRICARIGPVRAPKFEISRKPSDTGEENRFSLEGAEDISSADSRSRVGAFYFFQIPSAKYQATDLARFGYVDPPGFNVYPLGAILSVKAAFYSQLNRLPPGTYRVDVAIYSENSREVRRNFIVSWSGNWRDDEEGMFREIVIE